jgi:hypothetical protein
MTSSPFAVVPEEKRNVFASPERFKFSDVQPTPKIALVVEGSSALVGELIATFSLPVAVTVAAGVSAAASAFFIGHPPAGSTREQHQIDASRLINGLLKRDPKLKDETRNGVRSLVDTRTGKALFNIKPGGVIVISDPENFKKYIAYAKKNLVTASRNGQPREFIPQRPQAPSPNAPKTDDQRREEQNRRVGGKPRETLPPVPKPQAPAKRSQTPRASASAQPAASNSNKDPIEQEVRRVLPDATPAEIQAVRALVKAKQPLMTAIEDVRRARQSAPLVESPYVTSSRRKLNADEIRVMQKLGVTADQAEKIYNLNKDHSRSGEYYLSDITLENIKKTIFWTHSRKAALTVLTQVPLDAFIWHGHPIVYLTKHPEKAQEFANLYKLMKEKYTSYGITVDDRGSPVCNRHFNKIVRAIDDVIETKKMKYADQLVFAVKSAVASYFSSINKNDREAWDHDRHLGWMISSFTSAFEDSKNKEGFINSIPKIRDEYIAEASVNLSRSRVSRVQRQRERQEQEKIKRTREEREMREREQAIQKRSEPIQSALNQIQLNSHDLIIDKLKAQITYHPRFVINNIPTQMMEEDYTVTALRTNSIQYIKPDGEKGVIVSHTGKSLPPGTVLLFNIESETIYKLTLP